MASLIVPEQFQDGDFHSWLLHFERCASANSWDTTACLRMLPAFLHGPAAMYFESLTDTQKATYDNLVASLWACFYPATYREKYYQEFASTRLRPTEDPVLFLWRLKESLLIAEPGLSNTAFDALLHRQFMNAMPPPLQSKLLAAHPTPSLDFMVSFCQRQRAVAALNLDVHTTSRTCAIKESHTQQENPQDPSVETVAPQTLQYEQHDQLSRMEATLSSLSETSATLAAALTELSSDRQNVTPKAPTMHAMHKENSIDSLPTTCKFLNSSNFVRGPPALGWYDCHPILFSLGSSSASHTQSPCQPILLCDFSGVPLSTLVDTGSVRSILPISSFQSILHHCARQGLSPPVLRDTASRCMSISGQILPSAGVATISFSLPGSNFVYTFEFLVCDHTIQPFQCILGWDFIVAFQLQLEHSGNSYRVSGPHGSTPLHLWEPAFPPPSCNCSVGSCPSREEFSPVFEQSTSQGPITLTLVDNFSIPGRTECILEAKTPRSYSNQLGMTCPLENSDVLPYNTAFTLNKAVSSRLLVRVMNPSESSIQLHAGQKIAKFVPVVESKCVRKSADSICASVSSESGMNECTLRELETAISPSLDTNDKHSLLTTLLEFPDVFNDGLGHTRVTVHKIDTGESSPIRQYPRRLPYHFREEVDRQVNDMLSQGVIQPSTSPWSSPIVLVKKKDGSYRFCIDYRKLNSITKNDANPLPRVDDLLDALNGYTMFSTLDLRSGYWQVSMRPEDREKTAFVTPGGLYEFLRMPYGLSTAPATFSRAISIVLSGLSYETCLCYFDDVIIFSKNIRDHCKRLRTVLQRFRDHNLRVKASKCSFGADKVVYLGHTISSAGVHTDPSKIKTVQELPPPENLETLRSFLGLAGYYRKFIPEFATIAAPLTALTKKCMPFIWEDSHQTAFLALKTSLCSAPILAYPRFDLPFILQTDASNVGLGAVLAQLDTNGTERVVSYASRTLTPREKNYSAMEKEALAIVFATEHFRYYLLGRQFQIVTDNRALTWLHSVEPKGRIARWIMKLQEFDFTISHRPGGANQNADALSRLNHQSETVQTVSGNSALSCVVNLLPDISLFDSQHADPHISKVIELKEQGFPRPPAFVWRSNNQLFTYWNCWSELFVENGLLMRSCKQKRQIPQNIIVIPQALVNTVLCNLHSSPSGGHLGVTRTISRARERFFWPQMQESVKDFIRKCPECSQTKDDPKLTKAPLKHIEVSEPFVFWAMDYMGPIKETARGNKHILVLMDHFTKWCEAFPTKDQKASTVARILVSSVFSRFGPPTVLHSDQGRNFDSTLMHEIYQLMGVKKTRTTAYHPQCDGLVERQNRTLQNILSSFVSEHSVDWDEWLAQAVFAYNTSVHESTGISPYEMVFGRPARMPIEVELGVPLRKPNSQSDYIQSVRKALVHSNQLAQRNLAAARSRQAFHYDNRSKRDWTPYELEQTVWLWRPKHWKFGKRWTGPYKVLARNGVNYRLVSSVGKTLVAHHNLLKPCPIPMDRGIPVCPAPETPGVTFVHSDIGTQDIGNPEPPRVRPPYLRQVINPPIRYGDTVSH